MKGLNNFYTIQEITSGENFIKAQLRINKEHAVYKGHFVDRPVTPGVVQVHLLKEILTHVLRRNLMLVKAKEIKFSAIHNPNETENLSYDITFHSINSDCIQVRCTIFNNEIIFMKFNGEYSII